MLAKYVNKKQLCCFSTFEEQLNHHHPLYILANRIDWSIFEKAFSPLFSNNGRPAKPIRLMVSLILLKHIRNISDETVVEQWEENSYYQYFSGKQMFACGQPCDASELVHFRKRIGAWGTELILKESIHININEKDSKEDKATRDTTVQEKKYYLSYG